MDTLMTDCYLSFLYNTQKISSNELCPRGNTDIPISEIDNFRESLISGMKKMGATENELSLLYDETICNAIWRGYTPSEFALIILQQHI